MICLPIGRLILDREMCLIGWAMSRLKRNLVRFCLDPEQRVRAGSQVGSKCSLIMLRRPSS